MHAWGPADASRLNSNPAPTMLINSCRIKDLGQYNARQCCRAYSQWYPWICMWALARDPHTLFKHFTTALLWLQLWHAITICSQRRRRSTNMPDDEFIACTVHCLWQTTSMSDSTILSQGRYSPVWWRERILIRDFKAVVSMGTNA